MREKHSYIADGTGEEDHMTESVPADGNAKYDPLPWKETHLPEPVGLRRRAFGQQLDGT